MPNPNKALGSGLEARVVKRANLLGLEAHRQPGSGIFRDYPNDVVVAGHLGECKVRSTNPSLNELLGWLDGVENAAVKAKMPGGFLVFNRKGSRHPKVLCDLTYFLVLLSLATSK